MTTPEQHPLPPPHTDAAAANPTDDDDIWADSPPHHGASSSSTTTAAAAAIPGTNDELLSDLPTLRRQHMTAGYREGLSSGKAAVMQTGFDAGYPVGVLIGLRAGRVLGVLEGVAAAKGVREDDGLRVRVEGLLRAAREELGRGALLEGLEEGVVASVDGVVPERVEVVLGTWEGRVLGLEGLGVLGEGGCD